MTLALTGARRCHGTMHIYTLILLLVSCGTVSASKLKLTASPSQLTVGVSPTLTIQCTASPLEDDNSTAVMLLSLAISEKARKFKKGKVLASVTTSESDNIKYDPNVQGEVKGYLNETMGGHLTISIPKPTVLNAKLYECQLIFFNNFWEVNTDKARVKVTTSTPTRQHVVGQFKRWKQEMTTRLSELELSSKLKLEEMGNKLTQISSRQELLDNRLETLGVRLETSMEHQRRFYSHATQMRRVIQTSSIRQQQLEARLGNQTQLLQFQMEDLKKQIETVKVKTDLLKFTASTPYEGRIYYLSTENRTASLAQHRCNALGGHLVEFSSAEEFEHVQEFLTSTRSRNTWVGYTRPHPRGVRWVQMTHPQDQGYLPWGQGEPSGGGTCAYVKEHLWRVAASPCHAVHRFLCELPLP